MSQTLDRWIYGEEYVKERCIKKYFYLEWDNSYLPKKCIWLDNKPDNINYESNINWNIGGIKEKINIVIHLASIPKDFHYHSEETIALDLTEKKYLVDTLILIRHHPTCIYF